MYDPHKIIGNALAKQADWKLKATRSGQWVLSRNPRAAARDRAKQHPQQP